MDQPVLHSEIIGSTVMVQEMNMKLFQDSNTGSSEYEDMESIDPYVVQPRVHASHEELGLVYIQETSTAQDDSNQALTEGAIKMEQYVNLEVLMAPMQDYQQYLVSDELFTPTFGTTEETNTSNIMHQTIEADLNPFNFPVEGGIIKCEVDDGNSNNSIATINSDISMDLNNDINSVVVSNSEMLPNDYCADFSSEMADVDIDLSEYDLMSDWRESLNELCYNNHCIDEKPMLTEQEISTGLSIDAEKPRFPLKLDIKGLFTNENPEIQTPDVINSICSFESEYETHEIIEAEIINPQDILVNPYESPLASPSTSAYQSSNVSAVSRKAIRKRKIKDDDDEDYLPPSFANKQRRISSSDSDISEEAVVRRGRPCKQFDTSKESSEPHRYREMRDKNNEASRKSRQKRRTQEYVYEQERIQLEEKNVKLKAQVAELERIVGTYRDNMMNVMLNK